MGSARKTSHTSSLGFYLLDLVGKDEIDEIDEIDSMDGLSSQDKSYLLGFYLLDLVGKEFLTSVLNNPKFRSEYLLQETVQDSDLSAK